MQHLSSRHMSISAISQLLLTRFWWNFKGRFLGTSRTDSNCHRDICLGNSCPGDICPYQEYLSCYWPDFDETLKVGCWEHLEQIPTVWMTFVHATFVLATFVHIRNISGPDYDETLKIGSLEHLEQIPTVTLTFVQATFVLVTFVHFRKISAVTDMIWTKL